MLNVKTSAGTAFDEVAYQQYGQERLLNHLLAANPDLIPNITFEEPLTLSVPIIESQAEEVKPPWK